MTWRYKSKKQASEYMQSRPFQRIILIGITKKDWQKWVQSPGGVSWIKFYCAAEEEPALFLFLTKEAANSLQLKEEEKQEYLLITYLED